MPPLPVVSGSELRAFLEGLGYVVLRQRGSHIRLRLRNQWGEWHETVPCHREIRRGTLNSILKNVSEATKGALINNLVDFIAVGAMYSSNLHGIRKVSSAVW